MKEEIVAIPHGKGKGGPSVCFEGISTFKNTSTAASLHEAIQNAAKAAATHLKLSGGATTDFDVSRIQIVVGNPNVKAYKVVITPSG